MRHSELAVRRRSRRDGGSTSAWGYIGVPFIGAVGGVVGDIG